MMASHRRETATDGVTFTVRGLSCAGQQIDFVCPGSCWHCLVVRRRRRRAGGRDWLGLPFAETVFKVEERPVRSFLRQDGTCKTGVLEQLLFRADAFRMPRWQSPVGKVDFEVVNQKGLCQAHLIYPAGWPCLLLPNAAQIFCPQLKNFYPVSSFS